MNNCCTQCLRAIDIAVGINNPLMPAKFLEMFLPRGFSIMRTSIYYVIFKQFIFFLSFILNIRIIVSILML